MLLLKCTPNQGKAKKKGVDTRLETNCTVVENIHCRGGCRIADWTKHVSLKAFVVLHFSFFYSLP